MAEIVINIPKDFTEYPYGRTIQSHGDESGEAFLNKILFPKYSEAIEKNLKLKVILDGASAYGSSFLENSFGELVKRHNADVKWLNKNLVIVSEIDPSYKDEIFKYIRDAAKR